MIDLRAFDGTCGTHEECVAVACSYPQVWCEARQACIDAPYVECPECTVESPLWCEVTAACVLDLDTCTAACGDALRYCPALGACITEFDWCPSDDGGGGIPIPLLDAQLDRAGAAASAMPYAP